MFDVARSLGSRRTYTGVADVEVWHVKAGPWLIISVRDHGPGVAPEKLAQLTTPFFRGDAARTAATGAGLGLAIVEKAVARMGGNLELANAPEGGLIAHIRLKRVPSNRSAGSSKSGRSDKGGGGGRTGGPPSSIMGDSGYAWADTRAGAPSKV